MDIYLKIVEIIEEMEEKADMYDKHRSELSDMKILCDHLEAKSKLLKEFSSKLQNALKSGENSITPITL